MAVRGHEAEWVRVRQQLAGDPLRLPAARVVFEYGQRRALLRHYGVAPGERPGGLHMVEAARARLGHTLASEVTRAGILSIGEDLSARDADELGTWLADQAVRPRLTVR